MVGEPSIGIAQKMNGGSMLQAQPGHAAIVGGVVCQSRIDLILRAAYASPLALPGASVFELPLPLLGNRCGVSF